MPAQGYCAPPTGLLPGYNHFRHMACTPACLIWTVTLSFLKASPCFWDCHLGSCICKNARKGSAVLIFCSHFMFRHGSVIVKIIQSAVFLPLHLNIPDSVSLNDRRGSAALTTRHPSIRKSWH
jgi:hypothetical protein